MKNGYKKLKDKDATDLDWFMLEVFGKKMFGKHYEVTRPNKKKKPAFNTLKPVR